MTNVRTFKFIAGNVRHEPFEGAYIDSDNPANGRVWARVPDCRSADVNRAVSAAKSAFLEALEVVS